MPVEYPLIRVLDSRDPLFRQLTQDVALFHRAFAGGKALPPLLFYRYEIADDDDLYSISARTNLGVEAISTINGLANPGSMQSLSELILPNMPGVFMPLVPANDFERILYAGRVHLIQSGIRISVPDRGSYIYFPDEKLKPIERAFFLDILFRFPLREGAVSSGFGPRPHPFSGAESFHSGVDIAAPFGSDVLAARAGAVSSSGFDEDLGNFVVIDHGSGYITVYGHLDAIRVTLSQRVNSGTVVGTVGTTGLTTGPHLHFEVRSADGLRDPIPLIRGTTE